MACLSSSRKHLTGVPGLTPRVEGEGHLLSQGIQKKEATVTVNNFGLQGGGGGVVTLHIFMSRLDMRALLYIIRVHRVTVVQQWNRGRRKSFASRRKIDCVAFLPIQSKGKALAAKN